MAVLTARKASVLFATHDPMRPYMDIVLALANSVGERGIAAAVCCANVCAACSERPACAVHDAQAASAVRGCMRCALWNPT